MIKRPGTLLTSSPASGEGDATIAATVNVILKAGGQSGILKAGGGGYIKKAG